MDLNMMLRQQAQAGLEAQLDTAVTNGDTENARKISQQIAELAVNTTPAKTGFGDAEIRAAIDKKAGDWFGVDPKKTAKATEFAKMMDPKKFATPEAYADAVINAVDAELKAATGGTVKEDDDGEDDDGEEQEEKPAKARRTDGPRDGDAAPRPGQRAAVKEWTKVSDAPKEVQADIKRAADKFAPRDKAGRDAYMHRALATHFEIHKRKAAK